MLKIFKITKFNDIFKNLNVHEFRSTEAMLMKISKEELIHP